MSIKNRVKKLEAKQPPAKRASYQKIRPDGKITVSFEDGKKAIIADQMPGVKTYQDISPDDWDYEKNDNPDVVIMELENGN